MEDFAYLIGCTRQSIYNWEKKDREKPQSRMADLLIKLVRHSFEVGKVDVIDFLIKDAEGLGIAIEVKGKANTFVGKVIPLNVKKVPKGYFRESKGDPQLAAATIEEKEPTVAETSDQELIGILRYDYKTAALWLEIKKDTFGLKIVDVEFITNDDKHHSMENVEVKYNRILLLPETGEYTEKSFKEIFLKPKS